MDIGNKDQWIIYSGESQSVTNNINLLYDKVKVKDKMEMEEETTEKCEIKGKIKLRIYKKLSY